MPGSNGGFTMAAFEASKVPVGTKLYLHPQHEHAAVEPADGEVKDAQVEAHLDTLDSCLESFWGITRYGTDDRLLAEGAQHAAESIRAALSAARAALQSERTKK